MATIKRNGDVVVGGVKIGEVRCGDRIRTEDGFTLHYFRVESIRQHGPHFTFYGWENGERGELYAVQGEPVEVVISKTKAVRK